MVIVAWLLAGCVTVPLIVFSLECLAGLKPSPDFVPPDCALPFAVLIPAHDEAAGIAAVVTTVRRQLRPQDRLLVVADNCSDATADTAMRAGAAVCRRSDPARTGKAYALAFGRDVLRADPPQVVIVLDADCIPAPSTLPRLAAAASAWQAAVQARNLVSVGADATPLVRISSFAFLVKNLVRQRGLQRLGGQALLQGTGMAVPWRMFDAAPLATDSLVEDMRLGLDLILSGRTVRFDEGAIVVSVAASQAATRAQRTRWEHGALATAVEYLPRLLAAGLGGRPRLLLLAVDMLVPPLALLAAVVGLTGGALLVYALAGGVAGPVAVLAGASLLFTAVLARVWQVAGRAMLPPAALLRLPFYILWKQSIYGHLLTGRERRWVRTSRAP